MSDSRSDATRLPAYAELSPQVALDLLDSVSLRGDGRVLQLNSFENRVLRLYLDDGRIVVAKFYRPGRWSDAQIVEEHAFAHELAAAEIPVAVPLTLVPSGPAAAGLRVAGDPPTLAIDDRRGFRFAVAPCHAGRTPELEDLATLRRVGGFIGRIHAIGARRPFVHRPTLDPTTLGSEARDAVLASDLLPAASEPAWCDACNRALTELARRFERVAPATLRLHGDCHRGNLLWTAAGPLFVDLDDARNGPAVQDLWMLLDGDRATLRRQLDELLDGYEQFRALDRRETALIEPLRTLRMIHHSGWVARRWSDPAFPRAFPGFGEPAWWAQQTADLRDQLAAMCDSD